MGKLRGVLVLVLIWAGVPEVALFFPFGLHDAGLAKVKSKGREAGKEGTDLI